MSDENVVGLYPIENGIENHLFACPHCYQGFIAIAPEQWFMLFRYQGVGGVLAESKPCKHCNKHILVPVVYDLHFTAQNDSFQKIELLKVELEESAQVGKPTILPFKILVQLPRSLQTHIMEHMYGKPHGPQ